MKTEPVPGVEVDEDLDIENVELRSAATEWEALAEVYAQGDRCPGCMFYEHGVNPFSGTRWRECSCLLPAHCPVLNGGAIAALFPKQAS